MNSYEDAKKLGWQKAGWQKAEPQQDMQIICAFAPSSRYVHNPTSMSELSVQYDTAVNKTDSECQHS